MHRRNILRIPSYRQFSLLSAETLAVLRDRHFGGRKTASFTLQWHVTNACGNGCRHCYDRTVHNLLPLSDNIAIFHKYLTFSQQYALTPRVALSGGDPFLYPHFFELYEEICYRGVEVAILGNPIEERTLRRLLDLGKPKMYQISLEGLETTNDAIRGPGNFKRAVDFLEVAAKLCLAVTVMMTVSAENVEEVLPLARFLQGRVSRFAFNRLSLVGEGQNLEPVQPQRYRRLLEEYLALHSSHPGFLLKDNLFNILLERRGKSLCGGCTGQGCGAAFNFLALLPDGAVHACRKFPSFLGSIRDTDFATLYFSKEAECYRLAPQACRRCRLSPRCRGCLAVIAGDGMDWCKEKDRYCFREDTSYFKWIKREEGKNHLGRRQSQ
jgi:selenobiotic family peptide radical SAM maturase